MLIRRSVPADEQHGRGRATVSIPLPFQHAKTNRVLPTAHRRPLDLSFSDFSDARSQVPADEHRVENAEPACTSHPLPPWTQTHTRQAPPPPPPLKVARFEHSFKMLIRGQVPADEERVKSEEPPSHIPLKDPHKDRPFTPLLAHRRCPDKYASSARRSLGSG
jgi:hypothetical protein